jgi:hypothetical protein
VIVMEHHDLDPRARAIERARAETLVIDSGHQMTRVQGELRVLTRIRADRLANTAKGIYLRMALIAMAAGLACGSLGYWLRAESPERVQLHIIERDVAVGAVDERPPAIAAATVPVPLPVASASKPQTVLADLPAVASAAAVVASHALPESAKVTAPLAGPVVLPALPAVAATALPASVPLPVLVASPGKEPLPAIVRPSPKHETVATQMAVGSPVGKTQSAVAQGALEAPAAAAPRSSDGIDVVLPNRQLPRPAPPAVTPTSISADYKVVNVIEGAVVIRQGQSVRHIRIGEKMPDGQTLKNVNTDKGQFLTNP